MLIEDEQSLSIEEVTDLVTVMDQPDTAENVAIETRGFRHGRQGMIAERDNGTQHRYAVADHPVTNLAAPGVTIELKKPPSRDVFLALALRFGPHIESIGRTGKFATVAFRFCQVNQGPY